MGISGDLKEILSYFNDPHLRPVGSLFINFVGQGIADASPSQLSRVVQPTPSVRLRPVQSGSLGVLLQRMYKVEAVGLRDELGVCKVQVVEEQSK